MTDAEIAQKRASRDEPASSLSHKMHVPFTSGSQASLRPTNATVGISSSYAEQYLQPLREYLSDDNVTELVINPDGSIFIECTGDAHMTSLDVTLPEKSIKRLGSQLAGETKNALGPHHPIVSGTVKMWGRTQRVQVVVEPAVDKGVSLSIRKYVSRPAGDIKIEFLDGGLVDVDANRAKRHKEIMKLAKSDNLDALWKAIVDEHMNVLISGGTSSGKTTMARALISYIDPGERLVSIEDAQELLPSHKNYVGLVSDRREGSERRPAKLLESCLRMRPDRIIVGEVRGIEAYDFLEAINTGHPGAITTIHADSPRLAFERLSLMVMKSGVALSREDIIAYAKSTIDLVVQVGRRDGKRGVQQLYFPTLEGG